MSDPTSESRKQDHIDLAFSSQLNRISLDDRFYYEPMLSGHPKEDMDISTSFLGHTLALPIWVSSMTGGTEKAASINKNLATACGNYGMGMGLGSCRSLLESDDRLSDFDVKKYMPDQPLYGNLGIAQLEHIAEHGQWNQISGLMDKLSLDGLIIHINPLQEWLQPEGDRYHEAPIDTIKRLLDALPNLSIIVKEVGQGMGYHSLKELYKLPIAAVDFAAAGGTNFSLLELARSQKDFKETFETLAYVGHTPDEMVAMVNRILDELGDQVRCNQTIISGGVKTFLDGYYYVCRLNQSAIYGQASAFLKPALESYESLEKHILSQKKGLQLAHQLLSVKA